MKDIQLSWRKKFYSIFFKKSRIPKAEPWSPSAEGEILLFRARRGLKNKKSALPQQRKILLRVPHLAIPWPDALSHQKVTANAGTDGRV